MGPLFELITFQGCMDPVFANPPAVAGLPGGVRLVGLALAIMAIGAVALRRASTTGSLLLALLALTVPAAVIVGVAPALIVLVQNAAT